MRVLLIEGDTCITQRIEVALRNEDACVDATDTGEDGLDLSRHYDYDAIILDMHLPDMNGVEAVRALRKANVIAPILIISSDLRTETHVKMLGIGADGYMTKPFHMNELIARIRALVRRSLGHAHSAITTGMVTVNMSAKTVTANGSPVRLTDMEYQVMELLSLRRGVTVDKNMFINHLYGYDDGPESRTIELFICRLRKKLATATGGDICIETVGRRGYLLRQSQAA